MLKNTQRFETLDSETERIIWTLPIPENSKYLYNANRNSILVCRHPCRRRRDVCQRRIRVERIRVGLERKRGNYHLIVICFYLHTLFKFYLIVIWSLCVSFTERVTSKLCAMVQDTQFLNLLSVSIAYSDEGHRCNSR